MFFLGSAHIVWNFHFHIPQEGRTSLVSCSLSHPELSSSLAWGKRDKIFWSDCSFKPDLEEIVLFLPDHWYKSYGYWKNPRSLRSLSCLGTVTVVLNLVDLPHHMWHLPKVRSLSSNQILALTTSSINLSKNVTVWKYLYDQWISGYFHCIHHGE